MISWARCVLGQTQDAEAAKPAGDETAEFWQDTPEPNAPVQAGAARSARLMRWAPIAGLALITLGALGSYAMQWQRAERLEYDLLEAQGQVAQLLRQNQEIMRRFGELQLERQALDDRILSLASQLKAATGALEYANGRLEESQRLAKQLAHLQEQHQQQIALERTGRQSARQEAQQLKRDKTVLERSVTRLRQKLAYLERDYRKLSGRVTSAQQSHHPGVQVIGELRPAQPALAGVGASSLLDESGPEASGIGQSRRAAASEGGRFEVAGADPATLRPGSVELSPVVVRTPQPGMAVRLSGQIVSVDDAQRFVIIDKGSLDGVQEGMAFDILQGQAAVGQATAVRVRPHLAACTLDQQQQGAALRQGDTAVQRSP